jgi:DNA-binding beta-propeller fold protein YncE
VKRERLLVVAVLAGAVAIGAAQQNAAPKLTGGNGTLYFVTFTNKKIAVIDEATEKVVDEISLKSMPGRYMTLSQDRTRFYLVDSTMEEIAIIDIASRKTIDTFTLSNAPEKVRIRSFEVDPLHRFMVILTRKDTKKIDRWEIGPWTLLQYDLQEHKVIRTIPWPPGGERDPVQMVFSPDAKYFYMFSEDVLVYDTTEFTHVDTWDLSRPTEAGFGPMDMGSTDWLNEEPGYFTGIFTVQDPVQNRRLMGIARVNLSQKSMDFYPLGPATRVSFALAPGRKRAYGLMNQIGRYEFWCFDLENRRVLNRVEFPGRPRMVVRTSSNGKLLYIYGGGNTIDLYEAATYKYLRTITVGGDQRHELYVMPPI